MRLFDTHAHITDERFDEDRAAVIQRLTDAGVELMLLVGDASKEEQPVYALAESHPNFYAATGVHPHDADSVTNSDYDLLRKLCEHKKILAIGETGLDYHYDNSEREKQKIEFANHLDLAKELKLPVIIHEREAVKDALDIVLSKDNVGVFHCFSGSVETARILLNKGYYISFAGPVTFKNAKYVKEVAKYVPHDRFLIETDCPYLAPHPKRGERNNSSNLKYIVEEIATLREDTVENIAKLSFDNARRLFGV